MIEKINVLTDKMFLCSVIKYKICKWILFVRGNQFVQNFDITDVTEGIFDNSHCSCKIKSGIISICNNCMNLKDCFNKKLR